MNIWLFWCMLLFISSQTGRLVPSSFPEASVRPSWLKATQTSSRPTVAVIWNAIHLLRAGMSREFVKWLQGDVMREAIDIYNHIDAEDVRKSYLAHVPQLGV